jgi:hypothetical protein
VPDPNSGGAEFISASRDGSHVFFESSQKLTEDDNDAFRDVYERTGSVTTLISKADTGVVTSNPGGAVFKGSSADGSHVFFETEQQLTDDDEDMILDIYERSGGVTTLISKSAVGVPEPTTGDVDLVDTSADGTRVIFLSDQQLAEADHDSFLDVYERSGGVTTLLSQPAPGVTSSDAPAFFQGASSDGTRVFFTTTQQLTGDDHDTDLLDVYERFGGVSTLISTSTNGIDDPNTGAAGFAGASGDGTRVFFVSDRQLTSDDHDTDLLDVYERFGGVTTLISTSTNGLDDPNTGLAFFQGASGDGSRVFFVSDQQLADEDHDIFQDIYERFGGVTTLISQPEPGVASSDAGALFRGASDDGTHVFFESTQKLTDLDTDDSRDVYQRSGGVTELVSAPAGVEDPTEGDAAFVGASEDGTRVFFRTSQRLTAEDNDSNRLDAYERSAGTTILASKPEAGVPEPDGDVFFFTPRGVSRDGSRIFFQTDQRLSSDDGDVGFLDVYMSADLAPQPAAAPPAPPLPKAPAPVAPNTTLKKKPGHRTASRRATFTFVSDQAGSRFECKLDKTAFKSCHSPFRSRVLRRGRHSFRVRAVNAGGVDPTPALYRWRIS